MSTSNPPPSSRFSLFTDKMKTKWRFQLGNWFVKMIYLRLSSTTDFFNTWICWVTATNSCFTQLVSLFANNQLTKPLPYPLIELSVKWWGDLMRTDILWWDEREVSRWKVRFLVVVYKSLHRWNSTNHPHMGRNSFPER